MRPRTAQDCPVITPEGEHTKLSNELGDPVWYLHDEDQEVHNVKFFKWECSDEKILWAQLFILRRADGYVNSENKIVVSDHGTWNPILSKLKVLCEYWESYLGDTSLSHWAECDVVSYLKHVMLCTDEMGQSFVRHHGQAEGHRHILYRSHMYFMDGTLVDGLRIEVDKRLCEAILKPHIEASGQSLAVWLKGGSHGSIPIENGMVVLADAIELIETAQAKAARAFYSYIRKNPRVSAPAMLCEKDGLYTGKTIRSAKKQQLRSILDKRLAGEPPCIFASRGALSDFVANLYSAAIYIVLVLSGCRVSEWVTFYPRHMKRHIDGTWEFSNAVHKTNHSILSPRYLHGMAALALDTLIELSYLDKIAEDAPVLLRSFRCHTRCKEGKRPTFSDMLASGYWGENAGATVRSSFGEYYARTIAKHIELVKIHSETTPHQARHLWAEYCIRRFDGAVIDRISEHFRHRLSDNFIKAYYEKALLERERDDIERAYVEDILRRVANDESGSMAGFYGPAVKRARNELKKAKLISTDDYDLAIAAISEAVTITVDEWGYCLLREGEEARARCFNKELGTAMVDELRSFEVCAQCVHSCNTELQRAGIERSLLAHEQYVDALPAELSRLGDASRQHLKYGERRLREMGYE
ncbi:hypothetical protein [Pseudovibrio brasiliensis]|uniref:Phage integrase family protein n=1 Tax=Pseudovibrio brasiliensis TaxID=1898042 RepID=A0ABX8B0P8_9HYPH|nr:hypothetical protein [Pseudovibrio brasiliensis]QUS59036.1 hypothetical protein KGB56_25820 [Pseudovibrio brasiliensis]